MSVGITSATCGIPADQRLVGKRAPQAHNWGSNSPITLRPLGPGQTPNAYTHPESPGFLPLPGLDSGTRNWERGDGLPP